MKTLLPAKNGLHGTLMVPGDKSISHRAIMLGAISHGETMIHHFLNGEDCRSTMQAFRELGVVIEQADNDVLVHGHGFNHLRPAAKPLNMGNSGTTTRLMMGILAGTPFATTLVGDFSLQRRPMERVSQPLKAFGGEIELASSGTLPAKVIGHPLHHAEYHMTVASAQVKSALIFAALQADGKSTIIEKLPTRNHTEIMLQQFGAEITTSNERIISVTPQPHLTGQVVEVPGDISSAAFFLVAGTIVPNSELTLQRVNLNPTRTGIIQVLQKMGAKLSIEELPTKGEPLGNITVKSSELQPINVGAAMIPSLIDELPLVALLAACANGQSKITGAEELRVKETDRIKTVVEELRKLGVHVEELPDGMIIDGQATWQVRNSQLASHGDHRIGMMDAVAALKASDELTLTDEKAINISYPDFFTDLETLAGRN
ncbi:3-phosphoshikimate 1-carboxyvinyltransferase [Lactobacillus sp. 0.1XD8-4]|uniref:3-phosphoshikimate 1-carboxyvinyltransferase n=1 Tax=uncultured Limosilactobacillus sp. TaxID=2837629 RepID=UPI00129E460A|nr:3-phosphoshikimate 1-carboxyvinyltransferase [uncultured Limosilactobacillus sp.]MRN07304.1 3-phosphoshikimate 1-carboxyvinyltransferase [Lactobacillus sp. 0.1XD8-4]